MTTWFQDLKKSNPSLAADYALAGNQDTTCLRNMVRALESMTMLNTADDNARLAAAKRILRARRKQSNQTAKRAKGVRI